MERKLIDIVRYDLVDRLLLRPSLDPLLERDGLHEATLISMLYDPITSTFAILFDLRTSQRFDTYENTGMLILRSVSALALSPHKREDQMVWLVDDIVLTPKNSHLRLYLDDILLGQSVTVEARSAQFVTGFVEDIGEVAASLDEEETRAYFRTVPNWESSMDLRSFTSEGK